MAKFALILTYRQQMVSHLALYSLAFVLRGATQPPWLWLLMRLERQRFLQKFSFIK